MALALASSEEILDRHLKPRCRDLARTQPGGTMPVPSGTDPLAFAVRI